MLGTRVTFYQLLSHAFLSFSLQKFTKHFNQYFGTWVDVSYIVLVNCQSQCDWIEGYSGGRLSLGVSLRVHVEETGITFVSSVRKISLLSMWISTVQLDEELDSRKRHRKVISVFCPELEHPSSSTFGYQNSR